jgi:hypothetical protein
VKPGDLVRIKNDKRKDNIVEFPESVCLLVKMPHPDSKLDIAGVVPVGAKNTKPLPVYLKYLEVVEKTDE